jgi:hypothetical protein
MHKKDVSPKEKKRRNIRRRRIAVFFTDVEMFVVCTVLQPPLNDIVPSLLVKPLHTVLTAE